jgi:uncharacterized protein with von Willebrand factor type A (vWA) domain
MKTIIGIIILLLISGIYTTFCQTLSIQNIDRSAYPYITGEIILYDALGNRITNTNPDDWIVRENSQQCRVIEFNCPRVRSNQVPVSAVLTIDVSGSIRDDYRLGIAKDAASAWVNSMNRQSECAITTFSHNINTVSRFQTNKNHLKNSINKISSDGGGTGFENAFKQSALPLFSEAKNKKVLIFLTDGEDNQDFKKTEANEIIQNAISNDVSIYCLSIKQSCPHLLKNIAEQTNGNWYDNITNSSEAKNIYLSILQYEQNEQPCTVEPHM